MWPKYGPFEREHMKKYRFYEVKPFYRKHDSPNHPFSDFLRASDQLRLILKGIYESLKQYSLYQKKKTYLKN